MKNSFQKFGKYFQDTSKVQLDGIELHFIARKTVCVLRLIKFYWTWYQILCKAGKYPMKKYSLGLKYILLRKIVWSFKWSDIYLVKIQNKWVKFKLYLVSCRSTVFAATNLYSKEKQFEFHKTDPKVEVKTFITEFPQQLSWCALKARLYSLPIKFPISLYRNKITS